MQASLRLEQNDSGDERVNRQAGDIDERCDEWSGGAGRVVADAAKCEVQTGPARF